jgi:hypothetical protein
MFTPTTTIDVASRRRITTIAAAFVMSLAILLGSGLAPDARAAGAYDYLLPSYGVCGTAPEGDMSKTYAQWTSGTRCLIEEVRAKAGVQRLPAYMNLQDSAYRKASDISVCVPNAFDAYAVHHACGRDVGYWIHWPNQCSSWGFTENVYIGSGSLSTGREAVRWWLNSDAHRAAMLSPKWSGDSVMYSGPTTYPSIGQNTRIWVWHAGYCF